MFINACFAATNQNEYYTDRYEQLVSLDFLHQYVLVNYRRLYARALAAGINHFNQAAIVVNLLRSGTPSDREQREEEGRLISAVLWQFPTNRAYALLNKVQKLRINNRRTRAVIKRYLARRREPTFDAVKYRRKYRAAVSHAHVNVDREMGAFLFDLKGQGQFTTKLFETFQQAHYTQQAIYDLPFTVAESFAYRHGIPRDVFFSKIEPKMTAAEKLRYQNTIDRTKGATSSFELTKAPLTRLSIYILSLSKEERENRADELHKALFEAAERELRESPLRLGRVAAVLDASRSSWGTREKRRRPLAVALATSYLLRAASAEYQSFWTPELTDSRYEFLVQARGQTALAAPVLDALESSPDLIVIVSDGFENDPPFAVDELLRVFRQRIDPHEATEIVHVNPVFDADHFSPRTLSSHIATVGLRDAKDIATMLGFARFASGAASLAELEAYLGHRTKLMLDHDGQ